MILYRSSGNDGLCETTVEHFLADGTFLVYTCIQAFSNKPGLRDNSFFHRLLPHCSLWVTTFEALMPVLIWLYKRCLLPPIFLVLLGSLVVFLYKNGNIENMLSQVERFVLKEFGMQLWVNAAATVYCEMNREDGKGCFNMNPLSKKATKKNKDLVEFLNDRKINEVVQGNELLEAKLTQAQLCRHFTFPEIQLATHNFDDAFVIGKGGFGKVYKGSIDNGATTVAIKRLDSLSKQGGKEFWTEIDMLSQFRHSHLVSLIGYCNDCDEMILVYEYMSKGSIADRLLIKQGRNVNSCILCWVQRLKICIGAARGLDYLHTGTSLLQTVIHRDVKSSNILLDENWAAKISDFGLSKISPANQSCTHVSTRVKGTRGYIDPDYFLTHRLTRKSDVYAFGVVLFEVLSGRPALDSRLLEEERGLIVWAQHCIREDKVHNLIDPNLKWEIFPNSLKEFVKIANQCLHSRPKKRPTMSEVVASLESALALQERKDSSILDDYDFDFGGTCDDQEKAEPEFMDAGSGAFKPEYIVTTDDVDTRVDC